MYKVFDLIFCFVLTHFKRTVNINFDKQKYIDKTSFFYLVTVNMNKLAGKYTL